MSDEHAVRPHPISARSGLPWILAAITVFVAVCGASVVGFQNDLVALSTAVDSQWQQVENQLVRQHDLIPNLVEVTRAYAEHESNVFREVTDARGRYEQAAGDSRVKEASGVQSTLVRLFAVAEAYPQLRADGRFRDLQIELAGTQNRIALERSRYNEIVGEYNARLRMLPWSIFAAGYAPKAYFEAPADTPTRIEIDL
jgi:LemA protein